MRAPSWFRPLALVSCLLTVAASGDDFCLVRVVFPATTAGTPALPLDDPNTDFVAATDSPAAGLAARIRPCGPAADPGVAPALEPSPSAPPPFPPLDTRPIGRSPLRAPLRC
jgi:hypothetical protein